MRIGDQLLLNVLLLSCCCLTSSSLVLGDNLRRYKSARTELIQRFNSSAAEGSTDDRREHLVFIVLATGALDPDSETNDDVILAKVLSAIELGIRRIQQPGYLAKNFDITVISRDTFCSSIYGPIGFYEIYSRWAGNIDAVFGLSCDYVLAPISRYCGVWDIPVLTTGGRAPLFDTKINYYPTATRLLGGYTGVGHAIKGMMSGFNWTITYLIYQNYEDRNRGHSNCYLCLGAVKRSLGDEGSATGFNGRLTNKKNATEILEKVKAQSRIVIMCADPESIRQIMLVAEELSMIDSGEYVFINIELFSRVPHMVARPWYDKNDTEENNRRAKKAYTALLTVTAKQPDDEEYLAFSEEIKHVAAEKYNYTFQKDEPVSTFVTSFYDAVLLYAYALNDSINEDPTVLRKPINGTDMVRRMWNRSFHGITGNVTIDANGDRISAYSLLDMNPDTGRFEVIAHFLYNRLEYVAGKSIHWAGGKLEPPPDKPACGFDGSLCPDNSLPGYAILSLILGFTIIIMAIISLFGYRHYKSEAEINSMTWKINWNEVMPCDPNGKFRGSMHSLVKRGSQVTMYSEDLGSLPGDRQLFIPVGFYRGCKVAIKQINESNVNLNRSLMLELKRMKDIQHDHLVKFFGACLDPPKCFILTEYCPKGSLQDILENEQIKLDWMFKLSLMHDIVRGMHFLHQSDIKSHGNLKSSNCVVDSRFVLKVTDFGLHNLRKPNIEDDVENCNSYAYWKRLLWTAPELLRMENPPLEGTQKGDVYSFGIIVHEITTRQGPFYVGDLSQSPQEIIRLVKTCPNGLNQPFRPQIDETAYDDINQIMVKCWAEDPCERPDFGVLKATIRKINKDNETGNIVDNLLQRMEQYANNLEGLVEERTRDYLEEKKKCEKLLYQLLPQTVAAQLISGQPVIAETYDQVTIYFSDIVGFTSISAESTPMQVVSFLNDLYTCFDSIVENFDVYKVETIGDAYMVVSGLPIRNGNLHAREIARMALALLNAVYSFQIRHRPTDQLKLRIGLHSGPCVAGVVGLKMPRYCLFGDTVNTASRMESNGEALKIHISQTTKDFLDQFGTFILTKRGYVKMKGKGEMLTYWLEGEIEPPPITFQQHHNNDEYQQEQHQPQQQQQQPQQRSYSVNSLNSTTAGTDFKNHSIADISSSIHDYYDDNINYNNSMNNIDLIKTEEHSCTDNGSSDAIEDDSQALLTGNGKATSLISNNKTTSNNFSQQHQQQRDQQQQQQQHQQHQQQDDLQQQNHQHLHQTHYYVPQHQQPYHYNHPTSPSLLSSNINNKDQHNIKGNGGHSDVVDGDVEDIIVNNDGNEDNNCDNTKNSYNFCQNIDIDDSTIDGNNGEGGGRGGFGGGGGGCGDVGNCIPPATTTTNTANKCNSNNSNSLNFNSIVKTNNLKNLKIICNSNDDNVKSVTQPLLARINS